MPDFHGPFATGAATALVGAFEASYGTAGTTRYPLAVKSNSLAATAALSDTELLGETRDTVAVELAPTTVGGDITLSADSRQLGIWLKLVFGDPVTTDNGDGTFDHLFVSGKASLPSLSLETNFANAATPFAQLFNGVMANGYSHNIALDGKLEPSVSVFGSSDARNPAPTLAANQSWTGRNLFSHRSGSLSIDGVGGCLATAFSLSYSNNAEALKALCNPDAIEAVVHGQAQLTGSMTARVPNSTVIDWAKGEAAVPVVETYSLPNGHQLVLSMPFVRFALNTPPVSGPGVIEVSTNFIAHAGANATAQPMLSLTLTNDVASYA